MAAQKIHIPEQSFLEKYESQISTFFGFLVVFVIGIAFIFFLRKLPLTKTPSLLNFGAQTSNENLITPAEKNAIANLISQADSASAHVVQAGETYWSIAQKTLGSGYRWKEIADLNPTVPVRNLAVGKQIILPTVAVKPVESAPVAQKPVQTQPKTHVVVRGENLWKIAIKEYKNGYKWTSIYTANKKVIGSNPGVIRPGVRLTLPGLQSSTQ